MSTTNKTDMTVANEIARQIGGRAFLMMGATMKVGGPDFLMFSFKGCKKANKIKITLTGGDDYTVEFFKLRGVDCKLVETVDGIYCDCLHACIERVTGLYLSL